MRLRTPLLLTALALVPGCRSSPTSAATPVVEARALDGRELLRPPLEASLLAEREAALAEAQAALERDPSDADAWIWVGRRLGYLGRFRESERQFAQGAARFPDDPRFPRHRGHRLITLRRFAEAERELGRAALLAQGRPDAIEPAGLPNAAGIDIDWLQHSIHYHLGLARYCQGDWRGASDAFGACLALSRNEDARCSAAYWLVLALRRQGRLAAAGAVLDELAGGEVEVVEYAAYRDLLRHFAGRLDRDALLAPGRAAGGVEFATRAYGAAA
ncbi:MAG TPA: hypothetical protein VMT18_00045, partial [Planctomycetota bacterium]|nr:hypothetical protein [Planctomycetota bacterium]